MNKEENYTNISYYPGHMEKAKRAILKELRNIDIVYELVDSRIPKSSKIKNIYDIIGNKPKILIMTKKDLTDLDGLRRWKDYYEHIGSTVLTANLNDDSDIKAIIDKTREMMAVIQDKRKEKGMLDKEIRVLVVGIPNVGKSTLINRLAGKNVTKAENKPGVTRNITWIKTPHNITLLDTPGLLWPKLEDKEIALNLASFFTIKLEVLDVNEVAIHIINKLNKYYPDKLQERFGVSASNDFNMEEFYGIIAKKIGAMRFGEVDYERVSNKIINDLKDGYIKGVQFDNEI